MSAWRCRNGQMQRRKALRQVIRCGRLGIPPLLAPFVLLGTPFTLALAPTFSPTVALTIALIVALALALALFVTVQMQMYRIALIVRRNNLIKSIRQACTNRLLLLYRAGFQGRGVGREFERMDRGEFASLECIKGDFYYMTGMRGGEPAATTGLHKQTGATAGI